MGFKRLTPTGAAQKKIKKNSVEGEVRTGNMELFCGKCAFQAINIVIDRRGLWSGKDGHEASVNI